MEDSLDEEFALYGADREVLTEKLRKLSLIQKFALAEEIEDWWVKQN